MQVRQAKNTIPDEYLAVLDMCVLVLTAYLRRNADWSTYFLVISVLICTKLARSILMRDRNTGTQPNFQKRFLNVEFCRRKTVVLTFLRCVSSIFAAVSKINK